MSTAHTIAISLLTIAIPLVAVVGGGKLMTAIAPRQIPEKPPLMGRRRGYTKEAAASYWSKLDPEGRIAERKFLEVDLIFPFVYGGALLASMLLAWASLGRPFSPVILIGIVAAAMLADWVENLVHLRELAAFVAGGVESLEGGWIAIASAATTTKWTAVGASVIAVIGLAGAIMIHTPRTG